MPFYLYCCPSCDYEVSILKPIKDMNKEEVCKKCFLEMIRKPASSTFRLKGGGWYNDNYTKRK